MSVGPWHRRHPLAVDAALAICFALGDIALTLTGATWWPERPGPLAWTLLGLQALACLSLVARRRAPLTVVAVLGAFTLALTLLISPAHALTPANPGNVWAPFSTALAAYGPLFYGKNARNRRTAFLALGIFTLIVARAWEPSLTVITIGLLRTAVGPLLALYFDARRRLVCALTERAERAERERYLLAEQACAEERARLAGEMHDVVTHRVSLMVLQAGALRVTASDEATRRAAEELRAAGCQALEELRDLVGILRTAPEDDPTPSLDGFAALVAESTAAGVPVELAERGDRSLASPVVGRTAYRTVREALTNVHKHAPGARVTVEVEYDETRVRVAVRNTRPSGGPNSELVRTGSGLGIAGLRQRIELVHGSLRAGPEPDGGFCVEAVLPAFVPTAESMV
ncbi:sensor histidine kinase [Streptomyces violascens]|uniref:histidine kinase n=1 Tax=Streptomyces violascens TaxID=67381 RepID=A0ABQ3QGG8_9ACTN|nr:histidine kinase [Streptomyces violascens]GGT89424.1 two-component sensor histidine kinase [Streptomyces violascens]GHI36350.1 two-component sensor histidine kinase [Streptomyces violascens]